MKKLSAIAITSLSSAYLFALPLVTQAQNAVTLDNPLGKQNNTICALLKAVLNVALQLGIPVIIFFLVLAGFRFVLARGNMEALKRARENLLYTLIGIGIFLGAYTLAQVVAATINQLNTSSGNQAAISC